MSTTQVYIVLELDGRERVIRVSGRPQWALDELLAAGAAGCTPIDQPGPRWSDYVYKLKRRYGLVIETIHEAHYGEFPGHHARYVLRSQVRRVVDPQHLDRRRHQDPGQPQPRDHDQRQHQPGDQAQLSLALLAPAASTGGARHG